MAAVAGTWPNQAGVRNPELPLVLLQEWQGHDYTAHHPLLSQEQQQQARLSGLEPVLIREAWLNSLHPKAMCFNYDCFIQSLEKLGGGGKINNLNNL